LTVRLERGPGNSWRPGWGTDTRIVVWPIARVSSTVKVMNECAATLAPQDAHREDIMNTFTVRLLAAVTTVLGSIWLAPASHAMLPPPDPGPGTGQTTADLSAGSGGTAWQVIGSS
jgi:hypothetical protein